MYTYVGKLQLVSVSWELSAVYNIVKLSAYSKQHSIRIIPMDCGKFHMTCYIMFLLSTGRNKCQKYSQRLNHSGNNVSILELLHVLCLLGGFRTC